ncbi:FHA domain-containing protein [Asanoa sp. NPDC049573]|uniref:FHA domain-containing protein n=1 Tax=Asanoa sp. NPDC049573 TaxID=3155396 RepID=UPI00342D9A1E
MGPEPPLPPLDDLPEGIRDFTSAVRDLYRQSGSPKLFYLNLALGSQDDPAATIAGNFALQALRGEHLLPWSIAERLIHMMATWADGVDPDETVEQLHTKWTAADVSQLLSRVQDMVVKTSGKGLATPMHEDLMLARATLEVTRGPGKGARWDFEDTPITIGRDHNSRVQLTDESVSRSHARISRTGVNFTIEDLRSTNGTYLNAKSLVVGEQFLLTPNDQLRIGKYTLTFHADIISRLQQ